MGPPSAGDALIACLRLRHLLVVTAFDVGITQNVQHTGLLKEYTVDVTKTMFLTGTPIC